jgi:hypothetical protein
MDIKDFEALAADNEHGLVRAKVVDGFAPYEKDAVAGFPPDEALRLFGRGAIVPIDDKGGEIKIAKSRGKADDKPTDKGGDTEKRAQAGS